MTASIDLKLMVLFRSEIVCIVPFYNYGQFKAIWTNLEMSTFMFVTITFSYAWKIDSDAEE